MFAVRADTLPADFIILRRRKPVKCAVLEYHPVFLIKRDLFFYFPALRQGEIVQIQLISQTAEGRHIEPGRKLGAAQRLLVGRCGHVGADA